LCELNRFRDPFGSREVFKPGLWWYGFWGIATPVTQERDPIIWNITRKDHFQNVEALYEPWYG
jgi:hypothetical protein